MNTTIAFARRTILSTLAAALLAVPAAANPFHDQSDAHTHGLAQRFTLSSARPLPGATPVHDREVQTLDVAWATPRESAQVNIQRVPPGRRVLRIRYAERNLGDESQTMTRLRQLSFSGGDYEVPLVERLDRATFEFEQNGRRVVDVFVMVPNSVAGRVFSAYFSPAWDSDLTAEEGTMRGRLAEGVVERVILQAPPLPRG